MAICHRAAGVLPDRAQRAMNRGRGKILHPIEGQQQGLVHRTVTLPYARLVQRLEQIGKQRSYLPQISGVEQVADLIVRRDLMDPNQRLGVVLAQPLVG